jgi:hypothetical protein
MALDSCGAHALTMRENDCFSVFFWSLSILIALAEVAIRKKKKKSCQLSLDMPDNRNHFFLEELKPHCR